MTEKKGQLYAVDDILACKKVGGKFYYRIRWSGYGAADDTWEGRECFTAVSLSYFRPRLNALEQLWLSSGADRRGRQNTPRGRTAAPRRRTTQVQKARKNRKKTAATKKRQPTQSKKARKEGKAKNTRARGRRGKSATADK